ncbi:hypothetical protein POSPLADRAFT_1056296 [Postia placenta MAD-698-R-SB12]|uniref:Uncharacterized protein n=1 Tax=Postia placenta MAD-698-R-SB12 TaxID=670580 RepID=A0A1X6N390_9APHY|nr:hypothetical protein POSPLADRAFT_1056296 [Postia placenta MAD-698-R-SB12]OSX62932.1 hypothetical protein POSPLADRAFT_1056296 [Postia placenta MAD-698-R-SB12]
MLTLSDYVECCDDIPSAFLAATHPDKYPRACLDDDTYIPNRPSEWPTTPTRRS